MGDFRPKQILSTPENNTIPARSTTMAVAAKTLWHGNNRDCDVDNRPPVTYGDGAGTATR
jgi:hypothetical protein